MTKKEEEQIEKLAFIDFMMNRRRKVKVLRDDSGVYRPKPLKWEK